MAAAVLGEGSAVEPSRGITLPAAHVIGVFHQALGSRSGCTLLRAKLKIRSDSGNIVVSRHAAVRMRRPDGVAPLATF